MERPVRFQAVFLVLAGFWFTFASAVEEGRGPSVGNSHASFPLSHPKENRIGEGEAYVPNEILVKFRKKSAETLAEGLRAGKSGEELKVTESLDELRQRYPIRNLKGIFPNFQAYRRKMEALKTIDPAQLSNRESQLLRRARRAPAGARTPSLDRIYKMELELEGGQTLEEVVAAYQDNPEVEYAELNYIVSIDVTPNDPHYPIQWSLDNTGQMYPASGKYNDPPGTPDCDIDAPEAWEIYTGNSEVIVAVVDTGADYNHRDLDENMWINEAELSGETGIDDDGNGYIDDLYGYDFINGDGDPGDDRGHGTHCSGIIAAEGNNGLDVTGVCWNARIMALKFLGSDGKGNVSDAVTAFYYAGLNGADVISNSWGGGGYMQTMEQAIAYAHSQGVIMVASAGNGSTDSPQYPAYYEHMIAVAATDSNDEKVDFSNYGEWVDIAAPGVDVLSLRAGGTSMGTVHDAYTTIASGTSMACPYIAGACGLLLSVNPTLTTAEVYDILMETVDPIAEGVCLSDGRLNLFTAIVAAIPSKGRIKLDSDYYSCSDQISIFLIDGDLAGGGSQGVSVTTDEGDWEAVILSETESAIGVFTGGISTESADPNTEDGILQVADKETISVIYEDADDGTSQPATATDTAAVDCAGPTIFNVHIDAPGPKPVVTFETDETTTGRLYCGESCGGTYDMVRSHLFSDTRHTITLTGVSPETEYFFIIEVIDTAGNNTIDDNEGACYTFTTTGPGDIYVPSEYLTIQEAIDRSWEGGTVRVADGTYYGPGNRDIDFKGKAITVRSENGPEHCIIDCEGTQAEPHRGFYFHSDEDTNSVLNGLTITNGYGFLQCYSYGCFYLGGGIYCEDTSSPVITRCIITRCRATKGGGIHTGHGGARIEYCTISYNVAEEQGGGIYSFDDQAQIVNCVIVGNQSVGSYQSYGGGIFGSNLNIIGCFIEGNSCRDSGGGVAVHHYGGKYSTITNCTIVNNLADEGAGGIFLYLSDLTLTNSILWDNKSYPENAQIETRGVVSVSHSLIQGGESGVDTSGGALIWGAGNISAEPGLVDLAGPYHGHLLNYSPCLDAGTNTPSGGLPSTDVDGNDRIVDGNHDGQAVVDMGAYEFDLCTTPPILVPTPPELIFRIPIHMDSAEKTFTIRNGGGSILEWYIEEDCPWLAVSPTQGECMDDIDEVTIRVEVTGLDEGMHDYDLTISSNALGNPVMVRIILFIGTTIYVPENYPTIQDAIDAAEEGMTVEVADGIYTGVGNRDISFRGKAITVQSENGPERCIIDCQSLGRGFIFEENEKRDSILHGFTIKNGYVVLHGGGIKCHESSPTIMNCIISGNRSNAYGGGISCRDGDPLIKNCLIINNHTRQGGGIRCHGADAEIIHCTISNNTSNSSAGGGIYSLTSSCPIIQNCIIWGNSPDGMYVVCCTSHPVVEFTDIEGGYQGAGNMNIDPYFVEATIGDYHLKSAEGRWDRDRKMWMIDPVTSPCIDAGDPNSDWTAELWPHGGRINIGAYGGSAEASISTNTSVGNIADLNLDGKVDLLDYDLLMDWWRMEEFLLKEDLSRNGRVDPPDLQIISDNWLWQQE